MIDMIMRHASTNVKNGKIITRYAEKLPFLPEGFMSLSFLSHAFISARVYHSRDI
jgi:hypothetical protein